MGIGNFKYRVTFLGYTSMPDGAGGQIDTDVPLLTTWCRNSPTRSSRQLDDSQANLKNTTRFDVRYREGFLPDITMRMIVQGRDYIINSVVEIEAEHRFWEIISIDQTVAGELLS